MFLKTTLSGAILASMMASGAMAQNVLAADPDSLMAYFFDEGVPAKLGVDEVGDPQITLRHNGEEFDIYFYGCLDNANCQSIQFAQTYATNDAVPLEAFNVWNMDNFFLRAYRTPGGSARIEFDVVTGGMGLDSGDFATVYDHWTTNMVKFAAFLQE